MSESVIHGVTQILTHDLHLQVPSSQTDLLSTGTLDSLGLIELLTQIELHFGVRVDMDTLDVEDFRTVESIAAYVTRTRGAAPR